MVWAMKQDIVTAPTPRHVLLCLANYAGEDGVGAFPSVARLARDTGLSERAVQQNLAKLAEAGVIVAGNQALAAARIDRTDRRPNVWNIDMDATGRQGTQRGESAAPRRVNGVNLVQNGVNLVRERGEPAAPDPSIDPKSIQEQKKGRAPAALPEWLDAETWDLWCRYRNSRKGWTADAKALSLRTLTKLRAAGHDPRAVIEQSIERGWTGLFPAHVDSARPESPGQNRPMGKQMQGILALEALKRGNRVADGRGGDGLAEARLLVAGSNASG